MPAKWVEKNNIKAGDEVEIGEKDNSLFIAGNQQIFPKTIEMDIKDIDIHLLKRYINTAYKMGFDEVKLNFSDQQIIEHVQEILQKNMIGFEVINQGKNYCIIRSLSIIAESEFEPTLRRVFLLLLSLSEESLNAIKYKDIQHLKSAVLLEENNNRFTTYCRRILNKHGYKEQSKLTFIYYIIEELEKAADEFKYIFEYAKFKKNEIKKVDNDVIKYFDEVNSFVRGYYELFYDSSNEKISALHKKKSELFEKGYGLITKSTSINTVITHHLLTVLQGIYDILPHQIALTIRY